MTLRLTDPQQDRYQRLRLIRWWDQDLLQKSRVLIAGAGALGNEVAKNLSLLGVGTAYVVDFDRIETSNLTRSALFRQEDVGRSKAETLASRASELNPDCRFIALQKDVRFELGLHFLSQMDVILSCLDNREARYYLNRFCFLLRKTLVDGGLDTLNGSVSVFQPPSSACYECTLETADRAELQRRLSCLKQPQEEMKEHIPTAPTIASIIGGLQAQIGVRALHQLPVPAGKRLGLYGLSDVFFQIELEISQDCGLHQSADPLPDEIESIVLSGKATLSQILDVARQKWRATRLTWDFDRDVIASWQCTSCGIERRVRGDDSHENCPCGGALKPQLASFYSGSEHWGDLTMEELGFPSDHIYCAMAGDQRIFFTLQTG